MNGLLRPAPAPAPVTVVTGHVGAGKTSMLRHLLQEVRRVRVAVLVRDPAALDVGADLVAERRGDAVRLATGPVCCRRTASVRRLLAELEDWVGRLDHVVLEARGAEDTGRLTHDASAPGYLLDGIITVVDAEAVRAEASRRRGGERILRRLRTSDLVVVNKIDLLSPLERESIVDWLHEVAPEARLVETVHGRLAPALTLGRHDPEAMPGAPYSAWTWLTVDPLERGSFARWVAALPRGVLRAEGTLYLRHDPAHRYRFRLMGARWTIRREAPWGHERPFTRLIVLGPAGAWDGAWMDVLVVERLVRG